jgi:hypothetical protein
MALDFRLLQIERSWGKYPGWLATLPPEEQERVIALAWWERANG